MITTVVACRMRRKTQNIMIWLTWNSNFSIFNISLIPSRSLSLALSISTRPTSFVALNSTTEMEFKIFWMKLNRTEDPPIKICFFLLSFSVLLLFRSLQRTCKLFVVIQPTSIIHFVSTGFPYQLRLVAARNQYIAAQHYCVFALLADFSCLVCVMSFNGVAVNSKYTSSRQTTQRSSNRYVVVVVVLISECACVLFAIGINKIFFSIPIRFSSVDRRYRRCVELDPEKFYFFPFHMNWNPITFAFTLIIKATLCTTNNISWCRVWRRLPLRVHRQLLLESFVN